MLKAFKKWHVDVTFARSKNPSSLMFGARNRLAQKVDLTGTRVCRHFHFLFSNLTNENRVEIVGFSTDTDGVLGTDHLFVTEKMKSQSSYAPPSYIPLGQSDSASAVVLRNEDPPKQQNSVDGPTQWSSGICACCDDTQSCCMGLFCPCYLFGKNAEFLGSGTLMGSCTTHFILWVLVNTVCCLLTDGLILGIPGCFVACYACGYRRALRSKYNLQEAPCGDFITHFFCHLCAICQEYREIREKSAESGPGDLNLAIVTPPAVQTMEPGLDK